MHTPAAPAHPTAFSLSPVQVPLVPPQVKGVLAHQQLQLSHSFLGPPRSSHLLPARQVAEYENCRMLLVDKKISTARDIVGVLEAAIRGGYPLMIMAEDIEQEALATLVVNKLRGR